MKENIEKDSIEGAEAWIKEALEVKQGDPKLFIVGNKIDLADQVQIRSEEGKALADKYEAGFFEVSALTGENVTNAFTSVGKKLLNTRDEAKKDGNFLFLFYQLMLI